nr:E-beta-farnesene synthase [Tanacetum cinerariifolium]
MFYPRPDSSLHLPNEEHVLRYLKFSAEGTKREVFGMPIPGSLITAEIQQASYYQEYLAKVAQHRRYLAGEIGGLRDPPAPKPIQPARKPKSTAPKAPPRPAVLTPVTSAQPAPILEPAMPREKKRKQAIETSDKPPKAKKSKHDEDADYQKVLEESMKIAYALPRGSLPPMVIREPESRKYQPLPEVPGKGKAKSDSDEELEKVMLGADEGGQDEGQARPDPGAQAEDQTGTDIGAQDEGQAGSNPNETSEGQARSNPNETSEGQAGPNPDDAGAKVQSIPSPVVHAGSDREHMDLDVADVSPQPSMEQLDEGFTAMAYPKVQESLKLAVEEQVLFEEPASSSGTLSSLQHLSKDISFRDLFFSDRPSDADKNAETEVESMVNVLIQQAMSSISLMTSPIIDLSSRPESPKEHQKLKATTTDTTTTTTTTTLPPPPAQQQSTAEAMMVSIVVSEVVTDAVDWAMQVPLRNCFRDLLKADMKEILHQRMWETESYKSHEDHMQLFEPLEKSMNRNHSKELTQDLTEARKKKKKSRESPKMPPGLSISLTPADLEMDEYMAPDEQAQLSDDEDIESAHILTVNLRRGITELTPQDLEGPAYELVKVFHPDVIHLQYQIEECHKLLTDSVDDPILRHNVSKPLPLGGPPCQVTIQSDFFFNKDLEYLRYGSKGHRPALSISKIKATYYPDAGLEKMVPYQQWFYIDRHTSEGDRNAVRTRVWILSVVRIEVFSMYGYDYMKKIVLHRVDLNQHVIAKRDFKYLYPSDFEDLYLLNLQGHLNHQLPKDKKILTTVVNQWTRQLVIRKHIEDFQLGIESYQTQLNLTKPQWDATGFEYKHDYTVVDFPRAFIFRDKYVVQMMMRFTEIHKFSDGTLQQIDEALDYRVKEFRINRMTPGLNTRFYTRKDVDRCKAFIFAIQKRLRTRRIFRNLESFVGGRVREGDYRLLKRTE